MSIAKLIAFNNCLISTAQSRRFTATEDKANQWGKSIKELDRFYPNSKTCSNCGFIMAKENLIFAVRHWICPSCHANHDRDINASINILNQADKVLTLS
ncbi:zinc ribbon domain-containing protein [Moraxella lacunata]|uniref:zinc ribbon domain-containing protein n=1 Tax=Moraxella lacunata TaxID=477 RepID=UPI00118033AD|nr:zinc ribbon domain-containing protein [Moraxella lacunata]